MCANRITEHRSVAVLVWLGGGERHELGERHERSTHAVAGAVVLLGAVLAWLVAALAVAGSTDVSLPAVAALTLIVALLVGAVGRVMVSGATRAWPGVVGRAAVALAVGVVVGELAALAMFAGSIDRVLDEQAARRADSAPAVVQASADLDRTREQRAALDDAVEQARRHRDEALVVARCEFHPTPGCPQTHITGVPGAGPETRTATEFLGDSQRELDTAVAERDRLAPTLDADIAVAERTLARARQSAVMDADRGLGARWAAMNDYTLSTAGALLLRLATIAFFALLSLLPLILKLWRGETTQDRTAAARAVRERAELEADTAIAVKRAEVRAAAEMMWLEQQLASARMAVEAQNEIDREQQRRRVVEALQPALEPSQEAKALPAAANLPARVEQSQGGSSRMPSIPEVTKLAARWIRPFVPPIVARTIDTTTRPVRAALQVFEETEEIHFTLKRTHKVSVHSAETGEPSAAVDAADNPRWVESSAVRSDERGPELGGPGEPRRLPPAQ
ncbi:DUF4407 domain-containing protein [Mycobacterium hubeiense]|uniref:DUF4407 domain-containing protein n=1 Tax=Mycobacterium hubeiense TaxID=1867256 RepID=UPI000C7F4748|nr:DUF4407 domain-containing protein [Mycobacterium sp. QGD 101]